MVNLNNKPEIGGDIDFYKITFSTVKESTSITVEKSSEKILNLIQKDPTISANTIGNVIGISQRSVEKHIAKLKKEGRLKRIDPDKGGRWEVVQE